MVNFQHVNKLEKTAYELGKGRVWRWLWGGGGGLHSNTGLILSPETVIWGC